jgi:hypothetical protein
MRVTLGEVATIASRDLLRGGRLAILVTGHASVSAQLETRDYLADDEIVPRCLH